MNKYREIELRKIHQEIRKKTELCDIEYMMNGESMVLRAIKKVIELGEITREEGILALEEAVSEIQPETMENNLKQLIMYVFDGIEPKVIQEIGMSKYNSCSFEDYEALTYFIYLEGTLLIQVGVDKKVLVENLKAMLPINIYIKFHQEQEKIGQERKEIL